MPDVSATAAASQEYVRGRFAGVLLGTAVGDALGLPMEGMHAPAIARAFPKIDRYFLLGSDDTEQSALVAQSLAHHPREQQRFVAAFRRSLLGWFLRLPWGIGAGTLRACVRIALGLRRTGVATAGNGAAMRAAVVGAFFFDTPAMRAAWSDALARVTHSDPRAVEGARFVAEVAALCVASEGGAAREALVVTAAAIVEEGSMRASLDRAVRLAAAGAATDAAARELGCSGFVIHTVAITTFCFLRFGHDPGLAIAEAVRAGGDTDSNAAIVGAWVGGLHGETTLPAALVDALHDGPFGPRHLRALASDLARARSGVPSRAANYSWVAAWARNIALYPVVIVHAFRVFFRR